MTKSMKNKQDIEECTVSHEPAAEEPNLSGDWLNFFLLIALYVIQGFPKGLVQGFSVILQSRKLVNYDDQVSLNYVFLFIFVCKTRLLKKLPDGLDSIIITHYIHIINAPWIALLYRVCIFYWGYLMNYEYLCNFFLINSEIIKLSLLPTSTYFDEQRCDVKKLSSSIHPKHTK